MTDTDRWELRSSRVYGSQHEAYYPTEAEAKRAAGERIRLTGGVGRITCVTRNPNVVYFTEYEDDE